MSLYSWVSNDRVLDRRSNRRTRELRESADACRAAARRNLENRRWPGDRKRAGVGPCVARGSRLAPLARMRTDDYNYAHFRTTHLLTDAAKTVAGVGVQPGVFAPDFELPEADGGTWRLSEHLDKPVLLRFGSYS
jgi:hypothetical protein